MSLNDADDNFGRDAGDDRNFGERPARGAKPARINVSELAQGGGGAKKYEGGDFRQNVPKNLTNRVPGISELLEADSEDIRNLSRRPQTQFNPRFLDQQRAQRDNRDAKLDERQDYLYDKAEREKRQIERDKLRDERHRREMLQRSKFHKEQAKTDEQMRLTLEEQGVALISRTNQLGTMLEELRADFLEAQLEQQDLQKAFAKQIAADQCQTMLYLRWAFFASLVTLAVALLTFIIFVVYPFVKKTWFSEKTDAKVEEIIIKSADSTPKRPNALESSDDDAVLDI